MFYFRLPIIIYLIIQYTWDSYTTDPKLTPQLTYIFIIPLPSTCSWTCILQKNKLHSNIFQMKLSVKNLKGEVFQVEVEPADTIQTLKAKIQEAKGLPADTLKIVFKGKTAANEDTIEKLAIKETDFIVVMAQVAKPQPKLKEQSKPEPPKAEQKKEEKKQEKKEVKPEQPKPQPAAQESSHEAEITELMSMGFPREQCVEALRAAFFNVERAVEYLINGIPANLRNRPQQPNVPQPAADIEGEGDSEEPELGGQSGPEQLRAIFNSPQLASIRQLIRQNPAALQPILAQLAQTAPPIYNLIAQYPTEFEQIILGEEGGEGAQGQQPQQGHPPGTIMISQADEQAINRLRQLGFSKIESAQAYFACDKNEDLAANLLFDRLANGDIEMEPQQPQQPGQGGPGGQGGQGGQGGNHDNEDDDNLFN